MDDLAVERLDMILEQHEHDAHRLDAHEHVSGPAADDYRARVAARARFVGRGVTTRRNVARLLSNVDQSVHHGEAMTCVWRPETAACRTARIEQGRQPTTAPPNPDAAPDAPTSPTPTATDTSPPSTPPPPAHRLQDPATPTPSPC